MEQSLSITLNIQELGGPKIWVKASNEEHKKILQRLQDTCSNCMGFNVIYYYSIRTNNSTRINMNTFCYRYWYTKRDLQ